MISRLARTVTVLAMLVSAAVAHEADPDVAMPAPGYGPLGHAPPVPGTYRLPVLGAAPDATVVTEHGRETRLHALFGEGVAVLAFIYTHCDDVNGCPLASFVMRRLARTLFADPEIASRLSLVSYSFDPTRDTPARLSQYARGFRPEGAHWHFVSAGDKAALNEALSGYGQSVTETEGHAFAHVLRVFLIDAERRIRNVYSTAFLHDKLLQADIRTLLGADGGGESAERVAAHRRSGDRPRTVRRSRDAAATLGLPDRRVPAPEAAAVALGERLFFERRLSLNKTLSCAMCHVPAQAFTSNELATAVGIEGRTVRRNAPTLLNVGYLKTLFHDGRERRLEHQIWQPLLADNEMGNPSIGYVLDTLSEIPGYAEAFSDAFDEPITMAGIGRALAAFQQTLVAANSPFDRWRFGGEVDALDPAAQRGFGVFSGKGNCVACHTIGLDSALFTDQKMHNTGVGYLGSMGDRRGRRAVSLAPGVSVTYDLAAVAAAAEPVPNDLGRYEITQDPADRWRYRTPTLRNVALTAPYMHDGSLATLEDVVEFYDRGGVPNEGLDPRLRPLGLTARERSDLVAFLESLTSPAAAELAEQYRRVSIGNP